VEDAGGAVGAGCAAGGGRESGPMIEEGRIDETEDVRESRCSAGRR
jgi:hypothetical protein